MSNQLNCNSQNSFPSELLASTVHRRHLRQDLEGGRAEGDIRLLCLQGGLRWRRSPTSPTPSAGPPGEAAAPSSRVFCRLGFPGCPAGACSVPCGRTHLLQITWAGLAACPHGFSFSSWLQVRCPPLSHFSSILHGTAWLTPGSRSAPTLHKVKSYDKSFL